MSNPAELVDTLFSRLRKEDLAVGVRERLMLERAFLISAVEEDATGFVASVSLIVAKTDAERRLAKAVCEDVLQVGRGRAPAQEEDSTDAGPPEPRVAPDSVTGALEDAGLPKVEKSRRLKWRPALYSVLLLPAILLVFWMANRDLFLPKPVPPVSSPVRPSQSAGENEAGSLSTKLVTTIDHSSEASSASSPWPGWLALAGGFCLCLPAVLWLTRLKARRFQGRGVYRLHVPLERLPQTCFNPQQLMEAAEALTTSRRLAGRRRLDIAATVRATARHGGAPRLVFRPAPAPAPLLILVEDSARLAPWHEALDEWLNALSQCGAAMEIWHLAAAEPVRCADRRGITISLDELHARYPEHRLLVVASDAFIWDLNGVFRSWIGKLTNWTERSWLRPAGRLPRQRRWEVLSSVIPVFAFDEAGLAMLASGFRLAGNIPLASLNPESFASLPLSMDLPPQDYHLLCAAAVSPEIDFGWLRLARNELCPGASLAVYAVLPHLHGVKEKAAGLYALPKQLREQLLDVLSWEAPLLLRRARQLRLNLLRSDGSTAPGSLADLKRQEAVLELSQQEAPLSPGEAKRKHKVFRNTPLETSAARILGLRPPMSLGKRRVAAVALLLAGVTLMVAGWFVFLQRAPDRIPAMPVTSVAFHPRSKTLATASLDGTIKLWETSSGKMSGIVMRSKDSPGVTSLSYSPDGRALASGFQDKQVWLFYVNEVPSFQPVFSFEAEDKVSSILFSQDGKKLFVMGAEVTYILDADSGKMLQQFRSSDTYTAATGISLDGAVLAKAQVLRHQDETRTFVRLVDVNTGEILSSHEVLLKDFKTICFSRDVSLLAIGQADGTITIMKTEDWQNSAVLSSQKIDYTALAFSPDNSMLVSVGLDGAVRLWDVSTRQVLTAFEGDKAHAVQTAQFSQDASLLAAGFSDGTARVWEIRKKVLPVRLSVAPANTVSTKSDIMKVRGYPIEILVEMKAEDGLDYSDMYVHIFQKERLVGVAYYYQESTPFSGGRVASLPVWLGRKGPEDDGKIFEVYAVISNKPPYRKKDDILAFRELPGQQIGRLILERAGDSSKKP